MANEKLNFDISKGLSMKDAEVLLDGVSEVSDVVTEESLETRMEILAGVRQKLEEDDCDGAVDDLQNYLDGVEISRGDVDDMIKFLQE